MNPLLYSLFIGINEMGYVPIDPNAPEFRRMGTRLWAHPDDSNPHCSVHLPLPCAGNSQQKWAVEELKKEQTGRTQLNNRVCWTHGGRGHFSTELYSERFDQHQVAGLVKRMRPLGAVMPSSLASYEFRTKSSLPSISLFW